MEIKKLKCGFCGSKIEIEGWKAGDSCIWCDTGILREQTAEEKKHGSSIDIYVAK